MWSVVFVIDYVAKYIVEHVFCDLLEFKEPSQDCNKIMFLVIVLFVLNVECGQGQGGSEAQRLNVLNVV